MPPISYIYWLLLILWVIFSPGYSFAVETPNRRIVSGGNLLLLVLFILIGMQVFWTPRG